MIVRIFYQLFCLDFQYLCNLEKGFEAGLAAIADVGIDNAEALAEFFGKPGLLDAFLLKHFFDSIHWFIHRVQCSFDSAKI